MAFTRLFTLLLPLALLDAAPLAVQHDAPPAATLSAAVFSRDQLEQMAAPIALYTDELVAQVLMAATYPLEIVEAQRWMAQNEGLAGRALEEALKTRTWDPSVKVLCGVPAVLQRMSDDLQWTQDLGDAFLGQKAELMDAIQSMRAKALAAGTLKSGNEMKVREDGQVIVIESANPEIVYVPVYYPLAVYGPGWHYSTWYYPSFFVAAPSGVGFISFGVGYAWGANLWGVCGWHHHVVHVHVHHFNAFCSRTCAVPSLYVLPVAAGEATPWLHDAGHRKGVAYRSAEVAQRFGAEAGVRRISREQARGVEARDRETERSRVGDLIDTRRAGEPQSAPRTGTPESRPVPPLRERAAPIRPSVPPARDGGVRPVPPRPAVPPRGANDASSRRIAPWGPMPTFPRTSGMSGSSDSSLERAAEARRAASRDVPNRGTLRAKP